MEDNDIRKKIEMSEEWFRWFLTASKEELKKGVNEYEIKKAIEERREFNRK